MFASRTFLPFLLGLVVLVTYFYSFLFREVKYTIVVNSKKLNFTGIEDFIPPFVNMVSDFFVAPKYKIMACGIRKSMSQLTTNAMCLLNDEQSFIEGSHNFNETWNSKRSCTYTQHFRVPSEELLSDSDTVRFAFIRDPFERFVSFYLDKCLKENRCWNCGEDMLCILKNVYKRLKNFQKRREWKPMPGYTEMHASPLSWNCDFNEDISKWHFLMMGVEAEERKSSILQLANILRRQGVPDRIVKRVHEEALESETDHATHNSPQRRDAERRIREDVAVRDYLHKIYFFDYLVFPFSREHLDAKYQTDFWELLAKNNSK